MFIIDKELTKPRYSPICMLCKWLSRDTEEPSCKAFPDGIPDEIWIGQNDHLVPYKGDHNIQFQKMTIDEIDHLGF